MKIHLPKRQYQYAPFTEPLLRIRQSIGHFIDSSGNPILQIGKLCLKEVSRLPVDTQLGGGGAGILV